VNKSSSNVFVRRVEGGPWIPVTAGKSWSGKARWASSGRALYFISNRSGLFEIWGIRFDPVSGAIAGDPTKVLQVGNGRGISLAGSPPSGLSFAAGRLVLPLAESSGSVWMLEGMPP
jgi:hypothetical protein